MLILRIDHQSDAGIAVCIQAQLVYLTNLQPLVPERSPFIEARQIIGQQCESGAADLILAAQGDGFDPLPRHIVEANGRPCQQAISVLETTGAEGNCLPDQPAFAGDPKCLFRVDQSRHNPALVGQANGVNTANLDPLIEDGHSLLDGQIPRGYVDPLTTGGLGQSLVEGEGLPLLWLWRCFGRVKCYAAAEDGGEAARLHTDAGQTEGPLDAADVPETGVSLDEVLEARLDHQIQDHVLVVLAQAGIDDAAYLDTTEIKPGANPDRSQRVSSQVQHAPLSLITRGRAVQCIKLLFQRIVVPAGLQVDVVAGDQGIEAGNFGQRCLGAHQPEVRAFADQRTGSAVYLGQYRYLVAIFSQLQILHHPYGHPLIAQLGLARQNAVALGKIDANKLSTARKLLVDEPDRQQEGNEGQQPDWR